MQLLGIVECQQQQRRRRRRLVRVIKEVHRHDTHTHIDTRAASRATGSSDATTQKLVNFWRQFSEDATFMHIANKLEQVETRHFGVRLI